jgi:uncharacterized protein (TIGR02231 family)
VTVSYYTPTASWSPYYDINATSIDQPVTIAAKSHVSQWTGLDWTNVRLTLSTSTPSRGRVAPLFSIWFLRERAPRIETRGTGVSTTQNRYSYDAVEEMEVMEEIPVMVADRVAPFAPKAEPAPTIYDFVSTEDNALNIAYNIDLPYSIPGNGKQQNIDLAVKTAPAEFKYYAAPKLDGATYLIAEISDWQKLDLLSATANVTYAGTYIGQTAIDAQSTREKLTLTLGTDKRVAVTRELAREFSSTRAVGSTTEQTFTWKLTVRNGQTKPVFIVLKDQYPVSTDKSITVTLDTKTTTPPTANVAETGVVTWEETIAAGATKEYTLSYTVRYPKDLLSNL